MGDAEIAVAVRYERAAQAPTPAPVWITAKESDEFKLTRTFDTLALALALVFAIATGFSSQYLEPNLLRTPGDFFKLFLWGIGADQVKNFIQSLAPQS